MKLITVLLAILAVALQLGPGGAFERFRRWIRSRNSGKWPSHTAELLESWLEKNDTAEGTLFYVGVKYQYEFRGRLYGGDYLFSMPNETVAMETLSGLEHAHSFEVQVNPSDPSLSKPI